MPYSRQPAGFDGVDRAELEVALADVADMLMLAASVVVVVTILIAI